MIFFPKRSFYVLVFQIPVLHFQRPVNVDVNRRFIQRIIAKASNASQEPRGRLQWLSLNPPLITVDKQV